MSLENTRSVEYLNGPLKRLIDFVFSLILLGLPPTLITIGVIGLLIKLEDGGPVFFAQERIGKDGKPFNMLKLRTYRDDQVTRIGRIIRPLMLDELPQFINILCGHMSLFGLRALPEEYFRIYGDLYMNSPTADEEFLEKWKEASLMARPGGISLAVTQAPSILYRSHRTSEEIRQKMEWDIQQVEHASLVFEMHILWMFIMKLLTEKLAKPKKQSV